MSNPFLWPHLDRAADHLDRVAGRPWTSAATSDAIVALTSWYKVDRDNHPRFEKLAGEQQHKLNDQDRLIAQLRAENDHYRARVLTLEHETQNLRFTRDEFRNKLSELMEAF